MVLMTGLAWHASAAELHVETGRHSSTWTTEALLHRPDVRRITVPGDVAFHRTMQYRAVPLAALPAMLPELMPTSPPTRE